MLLAVAAVGYSAVAWADDSGWQKMPGNQGGHGRMGGGMMCAAMAVTPPQISAIERLCDSAQLSEAQLTKLDTVLGKSSLSGLQKKSSAATKALREAITGSKFDADKVKALSAKAEKAEADVVSASIDTWSKVFSILSPEQGAKLRESMSRQPAMGNKPGMPGGSSDRQMGIPPSGTPDGVPPSGGPDGNPPSGEGPGGGDGGAPQMPAE